MHVVSCIGVYLASYFKVGTFPFSTFALSGHLGIPRHVIDSAYDSFVSPPFLLHLCSFALTWRTPPCQHTCRRTFWLNKHRFGVVPNLTKFSCIGVYLARYFKVVTFLFSTFARSGRLGVPRHVLNSAYDSFAFPPFLLYLCSFGSTWRTPPC